MGLIVSSETGGAEICYANTSDIKSPDNIFSFHISCIKFYLACGKDFTIGVVPNYYIPNTANDYYTNSDRVFDFTLDLIKMNKK